MVARFYDDLENLGRQIWRDKTPEEIVYEFAVIRGDLNTQEGRDSMAKVIQWKIEEEATAARD